MRFLAFFIFIFHSFFLFSQQIVYHDNNNLWTIIYPVSGQIGKKEICGAEFPGGSGRQHLATCDHDIGFYDENRNIIVISTGGN
ncbi:hypothetical protein JXA84_09410 [candidate division WOR-3 bacterium]|nr:hypothetical protein [candidate division WOR-3 bacterium]